MKNLLKPKSAHTALSRKRSALDPSFPHICLDTPSHKKWKARQRAEHEGRICNAGILRFVLLDHEPPVRDRMVHELTATSRFFPESSLTPLGGFCWRGKGGTQGLLRNPPRRRPEVASSGPSGGLPQHAGSPKGLRQQGMGKGPVYFRPEMKGMIPLLQNTSAAGTESPKFG